MNWRSRYPILVVQAETLGALGVIRSLGRAGYRVHACSAVPGAIGLRSRYAHHRVVCPAYEKPSFCEWLREYLRLYRISKIIPSDSLLLAIRPHFQEFASFLCAPREESILYAGLSKFDLFQTLQRAGAAAHLPDTLFVENLAEPPTLEQLGCLPSPLFIKVDGTHSTHSEIGRVFRADAPEEARSRLVSVAPRFRKAVVQGFVPGRGVGAFFLLHRGEVIAEFMHLRLHEVPHTGGPSSLRVSWHHSAIRDDALTKLRAMQWEGVAMMEYRWEPESNEFYLLEMNGRFWKSLHLALWAGVDFPRLLVDGFHGIVERRASHYRLGVRCRDTFPAELQYLWSRFKDSHLSLRKKIISAVEFLLLGISPKVHSDLWFPGDRALYFANLGATIGAITRRLATGGSSVGNLHATQNA